MISLRSFTDTATTTGTKAEKGTIPPGQCQLCRANADVYYEFPLTSGQGKVFVSVGYCSKDEPQSQLMKLVLGNDVIRRAPAEKQQRKRAPRKATDTPISTATEENENYGASEDGPTAMSNTPIPTQPTPSPAPSFDPATPKRARSPSPSPPPTEPQATPSVHPASPNHSAAPIMMSCDSSSSHPMKKVKLEPNYPMASSQF
eukprot:TRINITY_DN4083_c0_g1::TRINITY_DN4083_c0_g1_i1::g.12010::m.12010 TRINITY_DN4083_c0_g1::TRINITY_DN4083_c0_g1_i1::g.12010  ORF type:complete len:202 (-),score=31.68 TRINITY_DN4083_c0_g1_i1:51-656(-)